jgi:rhamnose utilization protein RhaD (predicted bifunctional aldolase and dehydrogenase)
MNKELKKLIDFSHRVGKSTELIQGGGGNTSAKDGHFMYIKASGTSLKKMSGKKGYSLIDLNTYEVMEGDKPSMEWLMHAYLPKYVIHTHSVYANIFNCAYGGENTLLKLFKKYKPIYISYATPGKKLAKAIKKIKSKKTQLIFLKNHGLITCGENEKDALNLTLTINSDLKKYLSSKINNFIPFSQVNFANIKKINNCIFPDAAVFLNVGTAKQSHREIFAANEYIIKTVKQLKKEPHFLTKKQIKELQNMKSEKYRINLDNN